jgi:hypothetical protein
VCVVPAGHAKRALVMLSRHYPAAAKIGRVTEAAGTILLPRAGLVGGEDGFRAL